MEGWIDGRMDAWMEGWMDGWIGKAKMSRSYASIDKIVG